jgi:hypothetical protein
MDSTRGLETRANSEFANEAELTPDEAVLLPTPLGHEGTPGAEPGTLSAEDALQPVGAIPRSQETGRHDSGSGANETIDGLSETEEALRQAAEDSVPGDTDSLDDVPVFDRADLLPKI